MDKLDIDKLKNVPSGLSNLKSKVDKLDIGKIETTPVDISKLCNVVKNDVAKRTEYIELVKKESKNLNLILKFVKLKKKKKILIMVNI